MTDYPEVVRSRARTLFLDGLTIPVIATKVLVPPSTLRSWSRDDGWSAARREAKGELQEASEAKLSKIQAEKVVKVVQDQLGLLEELHQKIRDTFENYRKKQWSFSPDGLKSLTSCLKSANDVAARLLHLDDPSRPVDKQVNVTGSALIQFGSAVAPLGPAPKPPASLPAKTVLGESRVIPREIAEPPDPF
jgi:hypothetical protein